VIRTIQKLFIIGNGFDLAHGYRTKYCDFHEWLENRILEINPKIELDQNNHIEINEYPELPEVSMGHHGEDIIDINQSTYFLMWLLINNQFIGKDWCDFEESLYYIDLETAMDNNDYWAEDCAKDRNGDIHPAWADENYATIANNLKVTVNQLKVLFEKWINDVYIESKKIQECEELVDNKSLYLSFNYTETLEKNYNVSSVLVNHIHGVRERAFIEFDIKSNTSEIIVGHGNDNPRGFESEYYSKKIILEEIINEMKKPVDKIIENNKEFWEAIRKSNIQSVYSFGFGYGDVDLPYIQEIISNLQGKNITWYLNKHDDEIKDGKVKNLEYENIIKKAGFTGTIARF
jgi:hypothetical protein